MIVERNFRNNIFYISIVLPILFIIGCIIGVVGSIPSAVISALINFPNNYIQAVITSTRLYKYGINLRVLIILATIVFSIAIPIIVPIISIMYSGFAIGLKFTSYFDEFFYDVDNNSYLSVIKYYILTLHWKINNTLIPNAIMDYQNMPNTDVIYDISFVNLIHTVLFTIIYAPIAFVIYGVLIILSGCILLVRVLVSGIISDITDVRNILWKIIMLSLATVAIPCLTVVCVISIPVIVIYLAVYNAVVRNPEFNTIDTLHEGVMRGCDSACSYWIGD